MKRFIPWLALGVAGVGGYALLHGARSNHRNENQNGPHIVILGAGFAGLTLAHHLLRLVPNDCRITIIDRHNYHLFTPMLYQAATCGVVPYDVAYPVRQFTGPHGIVFTKGRVTGIDLKARRVRLDQHEVEYDYLAIALGSTTNFFGNEGAREHAFPLKSLEDGVAIRHQIVDVMEQATRTSDRSERQELLTFVVVGGGATGVETAAALADLLQQVLREDYPRLDPSEARVLIIESERKLLGHMSEVMANITLRELRKMGVEVWLNTKARDIAADRVTTEDGRAVRARTIIWTTGVQAPDVIASLDAPHGKGGSLAVDEYLQVRGYPGVYALGDCAHYEDPQTHASVPLLAAAGVQEGAAAAENLARAIRGQPQAPFQYHSYGEVVSLGHRVGVAEVGGTVVDGFAGWLAWRMIHLAKITSFRNKLATTLDWTVGYVYNRDIARLEVEPVASH